MMLYLLRDTLHLSHDTFGLGHLLGDFGSLLLESLQSLDDIVIIKNVSTRLVESLQQTLLELSKVDLELSLHLDQVVASLIHIRSLGLQNLIQ